MFDYFKDLSSLETGFMWIAFIATLLFVIQSVFTFLDIGDHFEFDTNFDGDLDVDFTQGLSLPFNLFSVRGIIGFFMLFGWSGLMFSKSGLEFIPTILLSFLCGFIMMLVIALIYYFTDRLGESGNVELTTAIGKECEVYIPIPGNKQGTGKVSIILNDSLKEIDAITLNDDLRSGDIVKVVDVLNDKLLVERLDK